MNRFKSRPLRFWIGVSTAVTVGVCIGLLATVMLTVMLWGGRPT